MTVKKKAKIIEIEKTCANCKVGLEMDRVQKETGQLDFGLGLKNCVACTRNPGNEVGGSILAMIGIQCSDRWEP
jgi:hypothetical protein